MNRPAPKHFVKAPGESMKDFADRVAQWESPTVTSHTVEAEVDIGNKPTTEETPK